MSRVLPILFNTEMVQAILDGRKTVTRRCIKYKYSNTEMKMKTDKYGTRLKEIQKDVEGETYGKNPDGSTWHKLLPYIEKNPPCKKGDILYVRETWNICSMWSSGNRVTFIYRADENEEKSARTISVSDDMFDKFEEMMHGSRPEWRPSIHMPKEAARIFLKVKDVRVERLQDITGKQAENEGIDEGWALYDGYADAREKFAELWDSTIKKSDIEKYGWNANPWVWVIEFERCEKPEEWDNGKS